MKKILLLVLFVIGSVSLLKAEIVNQTNAANVAKNHYFKYALNVDYNSISMELAYAETVGEQPVYYIFNLGNNGGFVIVSAEDNVYPILGYAFEGSYTNQPGFDAANFKISLPTVFPVSSARCASATFSNGNSCRAGALIFPASTHLTRSCMASASKSMR